jgi:hypothetical protein
LALHGELPVHERRLALRLLDLLHRDFALDESLAGPCGGRSSLMARDAKSMHASVIIGWTTFDAPLNCAPPGASSPRPVRRMPSSYCSSRFLRASLSLADQVEELRCQCFRSRLGHSLGEVVVELALACGRSVLVERDDRAAVLGVLNVASRPRRELNVSPSACLRLRSLPNPYCRTGSVSPSAVACRSLASCQRACRACPCPSSGAWPASCCRRSRRA